MSDRFRVDVITLFPEAFPGVLGLSVLGRALRAGQWQLLTHPLRDYAPLPHRQVDDAPFGGGCGQVLRPDVIADAVEAVQSQRPDPTPLLVTSAKGDLFKQPDAEQLAQTSGMIIVCGRYEGIDQRVIDAFKMREVAIGPYVLSGGEVAAQAIIETVVRLRPQIIGNPDALKQESYSAGWRREYPQFTRPDQWRGRPVPAVLRSGNHQQIRQWRQKHGVVDFSLETT